MPSNKVNYSIVLFNELAGAALNIVRTCFLFEMDLKQEASTDFKYYMVALLINKEVKN